MEAKTNFKYSIGYLGKLIKSLVFILLKMTAYGKTYKVKDGN